MLKQMQTKMIKLQSIKMLSLHERVIGHHEIVQLSVLRELYVKKYRDWTFLI